MPHSSSDALSTVPATERVTSCPLCRQSSFEVLFDARDRLYRLPGKFALVRCRCGLVFLSPRPLVAELGFYYPAAEYYSYHSPVSVQTVRERTILGKLRDGIRRATLSAWNYPIPELRAWERMVRPVASRWLANPALYGMAHRFPRYRPGGRALDIGCGNGSYLTYLRHHGWDVAGVEMSATAAQAAKDQFGIDVFVGDLADVPFAPASFDFIHMSHVIEHVPDPAATLRRAASLLKKEGTLYIETPNIASTGARLCGRDWIHWDPPRHLVLFSPATLAQIIEQSGLRVDRLWTSIDPHIFRWRDTFQRDDAESSATPRSSPSDAPTFRQRMFRFVQLLAQATSRLEGDNLHCMASATLLREAHPRPLIG